MLTTIIVSDTTLNLGYNVVMNCVVIVTNKCSDNHHFNVVNNFHCISYSDHH